MRVSSATVAEARSPLSTAYACGLVAAAALFAGCGSSAPQPPGLSLGNYAGRINPMVRTHEVSTSALFHGYAVPEHRGKSWISPEAKGARQLLFLSDAGTNTVNLYTMPDLALEGQITGLTEPQGMCADARGNIWLADTLSSVMLQYSRTGVRLKVLSTFGYFPVGCAVNMKNGDLAVANIASTNSSDPSGNVEVFPKNSDQPRMYSNPAQQRYYFLGYDPSDNLFIDGQTVYFSGTFIMSELAAGSRSMKTVTISGGTIVVPGLVQWYSPGSSLAVGDQSCGGTGRASCIYWVSISGSSGTITGTTNLSTYAGTQVCDLAQGVIGHNGKRWYVAGGDFEPYYCATANTSVNLWPYKAGGMPTHYNDSALTEPVGAAISTR